MNLLKKLKGIFTKNKAVLITFATLGVAALVAPTMGFADVTQGVAMSSINANVSSSLQNVSYIIHAISILGGIAFFVAFAFKAKQHRDNPTQVTIGQPLMYLFLAIVLAMLPWFISSSKRMVYGSSATVSSWDHKQMDTLFGGSVTP
jgi:intracellular multiplication protein IcmD